MVAVVKAKKKQILPPVKERFHQEEVFVEDISEVEKADAEESESLDSYKEGSIDPKSELEKV